jgi:hypothetical protein
MKIKIVFCIITSFFLCNSAAPMSSEPSLCERLTKIFAYSDQCPEKKKIVMEQGEGLCLIKSLLPLVDRGQMLSLVQAAVLRGLLDMIIHTLSVKYVDMRTDIMLFRNLLDEKVKIEQETGEYTVFYDSGYRDDEDYRGLITLRGDSPDLCP